MIWTLGQLDHYSSTELLRILMLRQRVFVIEQHCVFQEADQRDFTAQHLCCWVDDSREELLAYARILEPGSRYDHDVSIGRLMTTMKRRGTGLGKELLAQAVEQASKLWPEDNIRISGQEYLRDFYESFGFEVVSKPYMEDGIPHLELFLDRQAVA